MASGALVRVTTSRKEIARTLAKYDAQLANGELSDKKHEAIVANLTRMEKCLRVNDEWRTDEDGKQVATITASLRADSAYNDYNGVWDTRNLR